MKRTIIINNQITCGKCKETKDLKYFCKRSENNSYRGVCKMCSKGYEKSLVDLQEEIEFLFKQGFKKCGCCKETLTLDNFGLDINTKTQLTSRCKKCISIKAEKNRKGNSLMSRYKINIEQYNKMIEDQNFSCAICKGDLKNKDVRHIHLDHCHTTSKVRGILCSYCNHGLGNFRDNINYLNKAIEYLNYHNNA